MTCANAWSGGGHPPAGPGLRVTTKNKLGNTEIRSDLVNQVREELLHFFNRNKDVAEKLVAKVEDTRELRKELQEVKKLARERAKASPSASRNSRIAKCTSTRPRQGQGLDGVHHEGQSAAGSIVSCRDVNTQRFSR